MPCPRDQRKRPNWSPSVLLSIAIDENDVFCEGYGKTSETVEKFGCEHVGHRNTKTSNATETIEMR